MREKIIVDHSATWAINQVSGMTVDWWKKTNEKKLIEIDTFAASQGRYVCSNDGQTLYLYLILGRLANIHSSQHH